MFALPAEAKGGAEFLAILGYNSEFPAILSYNSEFQASLGYRMRPCLKKTTNK